MYLDKLISIRPEADKEDLFDVLLSTFDDGIWLWNLEEGKFDLLSPMAQTIFGSALESFNQDPEKWAYHIHTEDRERILHAATRTVFEQGNIDMEYRIKDDGGKTRWVRDKRKVLNKGNGTPQYIQGNIQDITEKKAYERRLEDTELSYKIMFLQHPNPMWVVGCTDGKILEANEAAVSHYGYSAKEFHQMYYKQLVVPGKQVNTTPFKQNEARRTAGHHTRKNGSIISVLITTADFVYNAQPAKLIMAIDVTRELADEQKIQDLNKRLSDFKYALTSSSIVSITDKHGIITYVNDNFLKISGYERSELIGVNHNIINSGHHPDAFFKEMWECITQGKIWRNDVRNRAKNGSYYWVDTFVVPLLDDKNQPYQYISIRNDITEKKATEKELAELNRQLEERVKKRTQALELANNSLQDFAYSISHDLRAPVRHIRNFAQIVLSETKALMSEESQKYQGYVIEATDRLSQQIEGLLAFSRVGCKLINYRLVDTLQMVNHVVAQANQQHPDQVCHFYVDKLPTVLADDILLEQVFANLISNALKYSGKEPESKVWITYEDIDGHHQFMVKDNGVGFDMAYAPKLFGMFSRLHSQSEFEGNGIGLANVKRIVERHEGQVWVKSELGKGAAFYFTLSKNLENEAHG